MRVAVIGLGDIAQKAYLPIITARPDLELVLCTRNQTTLHQLSTMYRINHSVSTVDALAEHNVQAAFVHAATEAHSAIVQTLLQQGVHVFVDKPLAYTFAEASALVEAAERAGRILMVGFNRRFAPMYAHLQSQSQPRLIMMQKNRRALPDHVRRVVFDDFIHVIDTLRFLAPGEIEDVHVAAYQQDDRLHQVVIQLRSGSCSLIGIMNRDSGATEEHLEMICAGSTWKVRDLTTTVRAVDGEARVEQFNDWATILHRRGFDQIVDHFLDCVQQQHAPSPRDALATHAVCEHVVQAIEGSGAAVWTARGT